MKQVSITRGGTTYSGTYIVKGKMLYVTYAGQTKATQVGGMKGNESVLARTILAEMIGS
ncbi:hypothetical protein Z945_1628 [Sulfitobacter noctilucae]|uniref:hypothetical protein n=1 Tax=Sulfitobacter noctilucae TaxID=1342302 RepID=UPI000A8DD716|nr:hypothetical protein [Sulfitobacter noctilucae]KIN60652.1 hypothetical protein Z945_1628 [Sulfitobacter noctilucae]